MGGDWDDLRVLLALARAGSLGAAAKALKIDATTVGRRLTALEESVGARLVTRTPTGVQLTAEGQVALAAAERMEEALGGLKRQLDEGSGGGVVKLTSTEAFTHYLFRFLPELASRHPNLRVEYIADNLALDLVRGAADIAVRFFRPQGEGLVVKKAGRIGWALYGSDAYLERKGPVELADLSAHDLVAFDDSLKGAPGAVWLNAHAADARVALRGNSPRALAEAVATGLGITVLPCFIAAGNPLLRRLSASVLTHSEAWTAVHADLKKVPRVRTVLDFVHGVFTRDRALLAGEQ